MAYQALYRRYRPATFGDVIGQEHITTVLRHQVASGRVSHAYLFSGTRGTGKTTVARILARAVNCRSPKDGEPCMECDACRLSQSGSVDIIELDAANQTGVDNMRDLIEKVRFMPLELKTKVYIIDEAHELSGSAFNALLKTLEEPPPHVMFILATTEPQKILPTIVSRCQRMDFHRLSVDNIMLCMRNVLATAGASVDDEGLLAVARAADGGMRDALSLLDQCIAFCGDTVTAEDVYEVLGGMDDSFMFDMADALIDADPAGALRLLDKVVSDGRDLKVFTHDLCLHFRNVLMAKLCGPCSDIIDCTEDSMQRYQKQAERTGETRLLRAAELLMDAQQSMRTLTLPRVLVESTLARIAKPEEKRTVEDMLERVELVEQKLREGVVQAPEGKQKKASAKAESPEESPPVKAQKTVKKDAGAEELWSAMQSEMRVSDSATAMLMRMGVPSFSGTDTLKVSVEKKVYYDSLMTPSHRGALAAILERLSPGMRLEIELKEQAGVEARARSLFGEVRVDE